MVATPQTTRPRELMWVTAILHDRPGQTMPTILSGQIWRRWWSAGRLYYSLHVPRLRGVVVIPHERVARMLRHPGLVKPTTIAT